jgi:DNA primase
MTPGGYIPEDKIEEVRLAADVVDVVGKRVRLTQKGKDFWGLCPFHGDSDPSLKVDRGRGTWHCFGCSEGGSVFTFVMKDEALSFPEAVRELAVRYGVEMPAPKLTPDQRKKIELRDRLLRVLEMAGKFFVQQLNSPSGRQAREYLFQQRGLDEDTVRTFGLGYAPDAWEALGRYLADQKISRELAVDAGLVINRDRGDGAYDRFRGRVMFPIRDAMGKLVSFGGRILGDGEPKYMNGPESPAFSKSRTLYNLNLARTAMRKKDRALVVEGYFDVITCAAHGFSETVAPMGTALTAEQVRRLKGQAAEAVLVFDGDQAGMRAATRSLPVFLGEAMNARVLILPQDDDPDTFLRKQGSEAFEEAIGQARPLVEMVLDSIVAQGDLGTPEGKSRVVGEVGKVLRAIDDQVTRWLYLERLANALELPAQVVASQLGLPLPSQARPARVQPPQPRQRGNICFSDERCLLELAMASPQAARELCEQGALQGLIDPDLEKVAAAVCQVLERGGEPTPASVMDSLEDGSLAGLVSQIAEAAPTLAPESLSIQIQAYLQGRARKKAQSELRAINKAIQAADPEKDIELVSQLQARRREIQINHLRPQTEEE